MASQPGSSRASPRPSWEHARGYGTHIQPPSPPTRGHSSSPGRRARGAGGDAFAAPPAAASPRLPGRVPYAEGQSFLSTESDSDEGDQRNTRHVFHEPDPALYSEQHDHGHLTGESGGTTSSSSIFTPSSHTAQGGKLDTVPAAPAPLVVSQESPPPRLASHPSRTNILWSDRFLARAPQPQPEAQAPAQVQASSKDGSPGPLPPPWPDRALTELPQARPTSSGSIGPPAAPSDEVGNGFPWRTPSRSPARDACAPPSAPSIVSGLGAPSFSSSSSYSGPSGASAMQLVPPTSLSASNSLRRAFRPRRVQSGSVVADPTTFVPTPTGRGGVFSRRPRRVSAISPPPALVVGPQSPGGHLHTGEAAARPQSAGDAPVRGLDWVDTFGSFSLNSASSGPKPTDELVDPAHPHPHPHSADPKLAKAPSLYRTQPTDSSSATSLHTMERRSAESRLVVVGSHSNQHAVEARFVVAAPPPSRGRGGIQTRQSAHHRRNSISEDAPGDRLLQRRQFRTRDRPATGGDSFSPTRFTDIVEGEASSDAGGRLTAFFGLTRPNTASAASPQAAEDEPRKLFSRRGSSYVPPRGDPWAGSGSSPDSQNAALPDRGEETPAAYVSRAAMVVRRPRLVALLSASGDEYNLECLRVAMAALYFTGLPIDFALRKFLAEYELPRETQQIDRVLEAFARRYTSCNPDLLTSDEAYIISFSLIMLHTDHFNPNNRNRMDLTAYLRNTQDTSGLDSTVLSYLFDNTTAYEFIYAHADRDRRPNDASSVPKVLASFSGGGKKVPDPCVLMAQERVQDLQVPVEEIIWNRLSFLLPPACSTLDDAQLKLAFVNAPVCEVSAADTEPIGVRVVKTSLLVRREGKARQWGCILSSSQLLWFRDIDWCEALQVQIAAQAGADQTRGAWDEPTRISPPISYFVPDEISNLSDAVAVQSADRPNGFDLYFEHTGQCRKISCDAASDADVVDWINKINFCAAYRWAGIRKIDVFATEQRAVLAKVARGEELPLAQVRQYDRGLGQRVDRAQRAHEAAQAQLDHETQRARHLAVLAPLLKSTRERIEAAAHALAAQLGATRLEWTKAQLRHTILRADLAAAQRAGLRAYLDVRGECAPPTGGRPEKTLPSPPGPPPAHGRRTSWVRRLSLSLSAPSRTGYALPPDSAPPRSLGNSFVDALPPG